MESLSHIWRDQMLAILPRVGYLTDALFQELQPILISRSISQFGELKLIGINFSLNDYSMLCSLKVLVLADINHVDNYSITKIYYTSWKILEPSLSLCSTELTRETKTIIL